MTSILWSSQISVSNWIIQRRQTWHLAWSCGKPGGGDRAVLSLKWRQGEYMKQLIQESTAKARETFGWYARQGSFQCQEKQKRSETEVQKLNEGLQSIQRLSSTTINHELVKFRWLTNLLCYRAVVYFWLARAFQVWSFALIAAQDFQPNRNDQFQSWWVKNPTISCCTTMVATCFRPARWIKKFYTLISS